MFTTNWIKFYSWKLSFNLRIDTGASLVIVSFNFLCQYQMINKVKGTADTLYR